MQRKVNLSYDVMTILSDRDAFQLQDDHIEYQSDIATFIKTHRKYTSENVIHLIFDIFFLEISRFYIMAW